MKTDSIQKKKKKPLHKKNNLVVKFFPMAKYDPLTGEKIAAVAEERQDSSYNEEIQKRKRLALMELKANAMRHRNYPVSYGEAAKDSITGSALGLLGGHVLVSKDSKKLKWLTAMRKKGLIALAGAGVSGASSIMKQRDAYNRQQAAREILVGKKTARSDAYRKQLVNKYLKGAM